MEEERNQGQSVVSGEEGGEVEVKDRGLFDFMGKKEEKEKEKEKSEEEEQADLVAGMEKVRVDEEVEDKKEEKEEEKKKKEGFFEKLHRSHSSSSSSSSSSDEEEGGGEGEKKEEKKKKKKKGLKEKIKEKFEPEEGEEKEPVVVVVSEAQEEFVQAVPAAEDDTAVTVEVVEGTAKVDGAPEGGEKKGFLEKIKEKLPGHKKPTEESAAAAAPTAETAPEYCAKESGDHTVHVVDANEGKENKKGFLGKIMEKLPGYGKGGEEKEKEKETEKTSACN